MGERYRSKHMIAERIEKRRRKKDELQGQLAIDMGKQVTFTAPQIKVFLYSLKRENVNDENNRRGRMPPGCPPPKRGPSRAEAGMKNLPRCGGEGLNSKLPCAMKPLRSNIPLISHHVSQAPHECGNYSTLIFAPNVHAPGSQSAAIWLPGCYATISVKKRA